MSSVGHWALLLVAGTVALAPCPSPAGPVASRFYFSGDGTLHLRHAHLREQLAVRYRDASGRYDATALGEIERFFRSRTDDQRGPISLRLIELIDFVEDRYRPTSLTLVSGYRSPDFNADLKGSGRRVAAASLHTEGLAADLAMGGVDLRRIWSELRALQVGGVGLYQRDGFLHLDTGRPRFWVPATSGVDKNLSADNARAFARTDFDRYADLDGAVVELHAVTRLPIFIRRDAWVAGTPVALAPAGKGIVLEGECFRVDEPAERQQFTIVGTVPPPAQRVPIRLDTCAPRAGSTPPRIETNAVEALP